MREGKTRSNLKEPNPNIPMPPPPPPMKPRKLSDKEIMVKVSDWYSDNTYLFHTDKYYGIEDIQHELFRLVKSCIENK